MTYASAFNKENALLGQCEIQGGLMRWQTRKMSPELCIGGGVLDPLPDRRHPAEAGGDEVAAPSSETSHSNHRHPGTEGYSNWRRNYMYRHFININ